MNSKQLRAFQVVFENLVPAGSLLCVGDLFSPGSAYLQLEHGKKTSLILTEDLVLKLPLEVFDAYRTASTCLVSSVFLGEFECKMLRHASVKPGSSENLGGVAVANVTTPAQLLPQFRLPSAIHLGGHNAFVVNAVLNFAASHDILCTLTKSAAALVTSDSSSQFDWLNENFETVTPDAAVNAFAIAVPKDSVDMALMQRHGERSLIDITPAAPWITSHEHEVSSLPVCVTPRLGFYADNGDGRNWTKPNTPSTLYLVAPEAASYRLLIEVDEIGRDLKGNQVAIVAGCTRIEYQPVDKCIELTVELLADEILPVTFILPTWSYQQDHDRWVGMSLKRVALLALGASE